MWWHNGTPEQDQLNAYWDAAVRGASPEAPAQADPGLDMLLVEPDRAVDGVPGQLVDAAVGRAPRDRTGGLPNEASTARPSAAAAATCRLRKDRGHANHGSRSAVIRSHMTDAKPGAQGSSA